MESLCAYLKMRLTEELGAPSPTSFSSLSQCATCHRYGLPYSRKTLLIPIILTRVWLRHAQCAQGRIPYGLQFKKPFAHATWNKERGAPQIVPMRNLDALLDVILRAQQSHSQNLLLLGILLKDLLFRLANVILKHCAENLMRVLMVLNPHS